LFMGAGAVTVSAAILAWIVPEWSQGAQIKPVIALYAGLIGVEVLILFLLP